MRKRRPPVSTRNARDPQPDLELFAPPESNRPPMAAAEPTSIYDELGDVFPGASPRSAVSIGTVTQTAKDILEGAFMPLWVRGEVTDFKAHRNGHWYFCLRDATAQMRCVVWSRDRRLIPAPPDEGMQVTALGQLTVYPGRGDLQFAVRRLEAEGDGLWRKALERTRAKLEADGLLARERKRPLPRYPRVVAVVTSPDGAAWHDVVAVVRRRAPHVKLVLVPAAVQGDAAPEELCYAIDQVSRWKGADTVIVGRGGGARDDLRPFNDERVARALASCPAPTISAVGHEIDVTICDLVADHRAPTPSAAAEAAVRDRDELLVELSGRANRLVAAVATRLDDADTRLRHAAADLTSTARVAIEQREARLARCAGRLDALSPLATLARGYSMAQTPAGRTLGAVGDFAPGIPFDLRLRDGTVRSTANAIHPDAESRDA